MLSAKLKHSLELLFNFEIEVTLDRSRYRSVKAFRQGIRERRPGIEDVVDSEGELSARQPSANTTGASLGRRCNCLLANDFLSFFIVPWFRGLRSYNLWLPEFVADLPVER
jgi:hypothetical protein